MDELKSCPFCGSPAELKQIMGRWTVKCTKNCAGTRIFNDRNKPAEVWNNRINDDVRKANHAENLADVSDRFICSRCGIRIEDSARVEIDEDSQDISFHEYEFKFCPECGADMRGRKHDNR